MVINYNELNDYRLTPKDEKTLETQLAILLTKNDWIVERQISSNQKGKNNRPLYRSDLIAYNDKYKELGPIGIELKYIRQVRCGGKLAKHLLQILKYRDCHFKGRKIKTWVLGAFFEDRKHSTMDQTWANQTIKTTQVYTSQLFNQFGIGWLNLNLNKRNLKIEFVNNDSSKKISLQKKVGLWDKEYKPDQRAILDWVNRKRIVKVINYD